MRLAVLLGMWCVLVTLTVQLARSTSARQPNPPQETPARKVDEPSQQAAPRVYPRPTVSYA